MNIILIVGDEAPIAQLTRTSFPLGLSGILTIFDSDD